MKQKLFTLLLVLVASFGMMHAEIYSGTCGDDLTWSLNTEDSTLTINGTGAMTNYSNNSSVPWYSNRMSIKEVIISQGCTGIGSLAFSQCTGLTSVTIPNSVTSIGGAAFSQCTGLTSVTIPNGVTSIGSSTFSGCTSLTSIEIPNSVTTIGNNAFGGCVGLTSIEIPNSVTSIKEGAFQECTNLTSVVIPNSVTNIEAWAFLHCTGLMNVVIPNSVTNIGMNAFMYVGNVDYSGTATGSPWGARSINGHVDGLFVYSNETKTYLLACSSTATGDITIPNSVTRIGDYAFYECVSMTNVVIPNSVTRIGNCAFEDCSGLTNVTIGNRVSVIGNSAFRNCFGLKSVTIPSSVLIIGESAFEYCFGITSVHISDLAAWCQINFGNAEANPLRYQHHLYLNNQEIAVTELVIPNSVTRIGSYIFPWHSALTSITIPNSVTSIEEGAFYGCSGLKKVVIPNSVLNIGRSTFKNCTGLTSISIPNSVISIGLSAFYGCNNLTAITIPNSVTSIEGWMFYDCTNLKSITIPNSVTSIGTQAFYNCKSLTKISIPESVTNIGSSAFSNCSNLKEIYSASSITPPAIESSTFNSISSDAVVYVSNDAVTMYKKAQYWKNMNIQGALSVEPESTAPTSVIVDFTHKGWIISNEYVTSVGIDGGEQVAGNTLEYIGLEPNSEYNNIPIVLTSNTGETETVNVSFTTTALSLTTQPSQPVSSNTAILLAQTNMADIETSCGFEWKRNDAPADMAGNKVYAPVANGTMAGRLKNLNENVYYKYRAFYQSATGNMYYGDWQYIFTGDVAVEFDPILYTYAAAAVTETSATLKGYALAGSDDFTEQGFEYWSESRVNAANAPFRMPAALGEHHTVTATGISMRVSLTDLDAGTVYRYRSYAKIGDQIIYGSEMTFTTQGTYVPPTYIITFVNWDGSELLTLPEVEEETLPVYTGDTPVRPEDDEYTYTFNGWSPAIVIATADATYTATYAAQRKNQAVDNVESVSQVTKILRDGQILILRSDKTYTLTGQEVR